MLPTLDGTVLRMFLPTKDFETSKQFYETLGFAKVLDGEVAIYDTAESGGIILQRYYQKDWAENLMLVQVTTSTRGGRTSTASTCPAASGFPRRSRPSSTRGACARST